MESVDVDGMPGPRLPAVADWWVIEVGTLSHDEDKLRLEAELQVLQQCSFAPRTGRGPQNRQLGHQGLPAAERLYMAHAERQAKLERKVAEQQAGQIQDCTFRPHVNSASIARHLGQYEYVPLHQRIGDVVRSKNEKLAQLQQQLELEQRDDVTFTPRINRNSATMAMRRSQLLLRQGDHVGGSGSGDQHPHKESTSVITRARSKTPGLRRTRSEADMLAHQQQDCSFSPKINSSSRALLQASSDIPADFLRRQQYFDRLAREKRHLLQLAVEDQQCSFTPATHSNPTGSTGSCSSGELSYLDRIERLAYQDKRNAEATRAALAQQMHSNECTFTPDINPRSKRMSKGTSLQELYENTKGRTRRAAVALAVQAQHEQECTFNPNLQKTSPHTAAPPQAKLSLSSTEVEEVVRRLSSCQLSKQHKAEESISFQQYQELQQCTFAPQITGPAPKQQGPVLVRGLGRFMELKAMAKQQQEEKANIEAKVFKTNPQGSRQPFTVPQPFRLGGTTSSQQRRQRQQQPTSGGPPQAHLAPAAAAVGHQCTFEPAPAIKHKSRQQRVQQLLERAGT
eukprot:gene2305-2613_t